MSRHRPSLPASAAPALLLLAAACGGGGGTQEPPPRRSLSLSPAEATVATTPGGPLGNSILFTPALDGLVGGVTWSVAEAQGGTVSSGGTYTAPATAGDYHVQAAAQADPTVLAVATVHVVTPPALVAQPAPLTVAAGQAAAFTVAAAGTGPLAYQWLRDGAPLPGATASAYTLPSASAADDGAAFSVRVANAAGAVTSTPAVLTVQAAAAAPTIQVPPAPLSVAAGQPASFSVTAAGTAPLAYQWMRDGVPVAGATGPAYTLPSAAPGDSGAAFSVKVTNAAGSATSSAAVLTVTAAPSAGFGLAPVSGTAASVVHVTGSGFSGASPSVRFGGVASPQVTVLGDQELTATLPAGLAPGALAVQVALGGSTASAGTFTLKAPPTAPAWHLYADLHPANLPFTATQCFRVDPARHLLYVGGKKGEIYTVTTAGTPVITRLPAPPDTTGTTFFGIAFNGQGEPVVGTFQKTLRTGYLMRLDAAANAWAPASLKGGTWPVQPFQMYSMAGLSDGTLFAGGLYQGAFRSTDGGHSFDYINDGYQSGFLPAAFFPTRGGAQSVGILFCIGEAPDGTVYAGTESAGLIRSRDKGLTWDSVDPSYHGTRGPETVPEGDMGNVNSLAFNDQGQVVHGGGPLANSPWPNDNLLLSIFDPATLRHYAPSGIPPNAFSNQAPSPIARAANGDLLLATHFLPDAVLAGHDGVYRSQDGGFTWTRFNAGIAFPVPNPAAPTLSLCEGHLAADGNTVFLLTPDGKIWTTTLP